MDVGDAIVNIFESIGQTTKKLIGTPDIQFGLFFFLLFFMALSFIKFGLTKTFMKDNEKQANVVAIAISGLLCLGLFVGVRDPVSQVKVILENVRMLGTILIGLGAFLAFRGVFENVDINGQIIKNQVGFFALGLGLWFAGGIGNYDTAVGFGIAIILFSILWLIISVAIGGGRSRSFPPTTRSTSRSSSASSTSPRDSSTDDAYSNFYMKNKKLFDEIKDILNELDKTHRFTKSFQDFEGKLLKDIFKTGKALRKEIHKIDRELSRLGFLYPSEKLGAPIDAKHKAVLLAKYWAELQKRLWKAFPEAAKTIF